MRFNYEYRTQDNVRHQDVIDADSREAAFSLLKSRGVKPFGLVEAPDAINRVKAFVRRGWVLAALGVLFAAVTAALVIVSVRKPTAATVAMESPRHQIYGDPALIEEIVRTDFAKVFSRPGERFLARFAQPGAYRSADGIVNVKVDGGTLSDLRRSLDEPILPVDGEAREIAELKAIVRGMKVELKEYLADGVGSVESYVRRLNERLVEERQIRERVLTELESDSSSQAVRKANETLRAYGLRTVIQGSDKTP